MSLADELHLPGLRQVESDFLVHALTVRGAAIKAVSVDRPARRLL